MLISVCDGFLKISSVWNGSVYFLSGCSVLLGVWCKLHHNDTEHGNRRYIIVEIGI